MTKKILVTGAGGFIGSALVDHLKEKGEAVMGLTSAKLDVTDPRSVAELKAEEISHIVHMAGKTFVPKSWEEPELFFHTNTFGTLQLLEFCKKHDIPMTYISAYIYGPPEKIPIKETDKIAPNNPYAKSKHMAEELCEFYAEQFGVKVSIIRPFNVYGAGQKESFLIPQIIAHAMKEKCIRVMDLTPKRDYIYLTDLLEAVYLTIKKVQDYDVFNIGSGISYSVGEVIDMVQNILGTHKRVECKDQVRKNELNDVVADISHAKEVLGWKPMHSLQEGLMEMIARLQKEGRYEP